MGNVAVAEGERVRSFAIITTAPNELCAELHTRMPVVLTKKGRHQLAREGGDGDDHSDAAFGAFQFPRFGRGWRIDAAVYRKRGGHDRDRLVDPGVC